MTYKIGAAAWIVTAIGIGTLWHITDQAQNTNRKDVVMAQTGPNADKLEKRDPSTPGENYLRMEQQIAILKGELSVYREAFRLMLGLGENELKALETGTEGIGYVQTGVGGKDNLPAALKYNLETRYAVELNHQKLSVKRCPRGYSSSTAVFIHNTIENIAKNNPRQPTISQKYRRNLDIIPTGAVFFYRLPENVGQLLKPCPPTSYNAK